MQKNTKHYQKAAEFGWKSNFFGAILNLDFRATIDDQIFNNPLSPK